MLLTEGRYEGFTGVENSVAFCVVGVGGLAGGEAMVWATSKLDATKQKPAAK
jgi:hypothetical protein